MSGACADVVLSEIPEPGIVVITLNRPARRNAFDSAMAGALERAIDDYEADPDLRCAVITGTSEVFSAGQDLRAAAVGDLAVTERRGGFGIMNRPPDKVVIAAVEGPALAGGFELALVCDLIVASSASVFGLPEVTRSLVAVGGALLRLPRRIPYAAAVEMALTGSPRPAQDLHRWGLVARLAEPGSACAAALELARVISANGPLAVTATKKIIGRTGGDVPESAWAEQAGIAGPVHRSADMREGLAAFAEKRTPVWSGR